MFGSVTHRPVSLTPRVHLDHERQRRQPLGIAQGALGEGPVGRVPHQLGRQVVGGVREGERDHAGLGDGSVGDISPGESAVP